MADISKITLPGNITLDIKDATARAMISGETVIEDFKYDIIDNNSALNMGNCSFLRVGKVCIVSLQGNNINTWAPAFEVCQLPFAPKQTVRAPFTINAGVVGNLYANAGTGKVTINQISDTGTTGRIYCSFVYFTE